ncbi:MAG: gamma-glutamyl-gamma-aminobutyrate hydrolase family protein [Anaerolineaceae bacterium]|jgi:putative glutamine amidotransferase|nr:gamma-glutamyl-gamma-aminobutyrate hydrolase family protein [Anaerolineaceae bacterium]MDD4578757.1 gamma-glutamyl-gamma-aminobutyrate hydrolase family protein [Anaerolineaceae bacterium]
MNKPLIGIPAGRIVGKVCSPTYQSRQVDIQAILAAGGLPFLLPAAIALDELPGIVTKFDGFYLTGGGDLDPTLFGESNHERIYGVNPERDAFEIALVSQTISQDKPLLTVCRGTQVLNVACGGTLFVDIASHIPGAQKHDWYPTYKRDKLVHDVSITPGSRLARILGVNSVRTNSLHHQSINRVADGLNAVAFAADGVIEAVEYPDKRFVIGVQWHPEWLQDQAPMRDLYRAFIGAL